MKYTKDQLDGIAIAIICIFFSLFLGFMIGSFVAINSPECRNQNETETTEIFKYKCNENKIYWSAQNCFGDECWLMDKKPIQHCEDHYYEKEVIIKK
jgi:hypothetical protein